jgi:hypothetical protein
MKQFNAKTKFNCTLIIIKYRVPRKSEKGSTLEGTGRHVAQAALGRARLAKKVPCQQLVLNRPICPANVSPDVAISPALSDRVGHVLKIPGSKVMEECKFVQTLALLLYCQAAGSDDPRR